METDIMLLELLEVLERSMIGRYIEALRLRMLQRKLNPKALVSRTDCLLVLEVKVHFLPNPSPA